ncbi:MAG: hypothetical protein HQL63_14555 [Magnetococcales bacterium]|nr:hypothetical protein [Magnetococcales bacterium]
MTAPEQDPEWKVRAYEFTGLAIYEREGAESDRLKTLFDLAVQPYVPDGSSFDAFFAGVRRLRRSFCEQHDDQVCRCADRVQPAANDEELLRPAAQVAGLQPIAVGEELLKPAARAAGSPSVAVGGERKIAVALDLAFPNKLSPAPGRTPEDASPAQKTPLLPTVQVPPPKKEMFSVRRASPQGQTLQ